MSKVDDVIADASRELGKPYVFGDEGPNAFDCSGLMQFVFAQVGIHLPRTAAQQQAATTRVATPAPGDLVFFGEPAHHVGLYIGGGRMISAPHAGAVVHIAGVGNPSNYGRVAGLGAGAAAAVGVLTGAVGTVASPIGDLLGGARDLVVQALFAALGVGLVGYGLYRTVRPAGRAAVAHLTGGAIT
jgi:hypothetical protein